MKIRAFFKAVPFLVILILSSCVSFPVNDGASKSLVIVPVEWSEHASDAQLHQYLVISSLESGQEYGKTSLATHKGYAYIKDLPPGGYYVSQIITKLNGELFEQQSTDHGYCTFFVYEGKITFTPIIFKPYSRKPSPTSVSFGIKTTRDFTGDAQKALYEEIKDQFPEEVESWEVASFNGMDLDIFKD